MNQTFFRSGFLCSLKIFLGLLALSATSSLQAAEVALLGGISRSTPFYSHEGTSTGLLPSGSASTGFAYGAAVSLGIFPFFALESGALWTQKSYETNDRGVLTDVKFTQIQIPLMLKFVGLHPNLHFGGGAYYARGQSPVTFQRRGSPATEQGLPESGIRSTDFGFIGSVGFGYDPLPMTHLGLELRYLKGLRDLANSTSLNLTMDDVQLLVRFGVGL
jgi:hypothetical protein